LLITQEFVNNFLSYQQNMLITLEIFDKLLRNIVEGCDVLLVTNASILVQIWMSGMFDGICFHCTLERIVIVCVQLHNCWLDEPSWWRSMLCVLSLILIWSQCSVSQAHISHSLSVCLSVSLSVCVSMCLSVYCAREAATSSAATVSLCCIQLVGKLLFHDGDKKNQNFQC